MTLLERRALRLANFRPRQFWLGTAAWMLFFVYPLLPGWLLKVAYNELRSERISAKFLLGCAGMILAEIAMAIVLWRGHATYMRGFEAGHALVRANALDAQLASGGPTMGTRMLSPGDAVARFRDDPTDLLMLVDNWVDVVGAFIYALVAVGVLSAIDPFAALAAIVPLIAIGFLNRVAGNRIRKVRSRARSMSSDTTDFLASAFGGSLTVKVSGAMPGVLRRIDELNAKRSRAMVSDQTWSNALWSVNTAAVDICVGLALLVASRRNLETGEIALFAAYTIQLIWLPQKVGGLVVGRRRFEVAAKRLDELLPSPTTGALADDRLSEHRSLPVLGGSAMPTRVLRPREPLERLEVRGLSVTSRDLSDVSFTVVRGTITVVSGPVGSGKSTLLRALIGLVPIDEGEVLWNGRVVEDRAAFFVPPHCAYVSQVPHLFSETLLDNVLLGAEGDVDEALRLAAFDEDVRSMPDGHDTVIGSGGVRLSGGQAQRAAAARALVHRSELVLFDDLTSALDIDTEISMWDRLAASSATIIAVSNRTIALDRANQVIEL